MEKMDANADLTWASMARPVIGTGLVTGLVTASLNVFGARGLDWYREKQQNQKKAQYSALLIAISLECFAIECANIVADHNYINDRAAGLGENVGTRHVSLPKIAEHANSIDW